MGSWPWLFSSKMEDSRPCLEGCRSPLFQGSVALETCGSSGIGRGAGFWCCVFWWFLMFFWWFWWCAFLWWFFMFFFDGFWRKCLISLMVEVNFLDGLRRFRQQRSITKSTDRTWDRNSAGLTTYHRGSDCKLDGIWQELGTFPDVHLFRQQLQLMDTAAPVEMVVSNCQAHLCTVSGAVCGETSSLN